MPYFITILFYQLWEIKNLTLMMISHFLLLPLLRNLEIHSDLISPIIKHHLLSMVLLLNKSKKHQGKFLEITIHFVL